MEDLYREFHKSVVNALDRLCREINYLAERTLSAKDYIDFVKEFTKDKSKKDGE